MPVCGPHCLHPQLSCLWSNEQFPTFSSLSLVLIQNPQSLDHWLFFCVSQFLFCILPSSEFRAICNLTSSSASSLTSHTHHASVPWLGKTSTWNGSTYAPSMPLSTAEQTTPFISSSATLVILFPWPASPTPLPGHSHFLESSVHTPTPSTPRYPVPGASSSPLSQTEKIP